MSGAEVECGIDRSSNEVRSKRPCLFMFRSALHLLLAVYYVCASSYGLCIFYYAFTSDVETHRFMAKFSFAFGTNWNVTFQAVFAFLALAHDALEWADKHNSLIAQKLTYWRDVIFNALVVPYTLFVATMFWCIYWVDRELVFPKVYDAIIPWWFNHCVHTNVAIIVLVETLLTARRHPTNMKLELIINSVVAFGYAIVYYSIYFATNRWLYNVFGVMTWWQVCLYQIVIWSSGYFFYFIHFPINRMIHGSIDETTKENEEDVSSTVNKVNGTDFAKNMPENKSEFTKDNFSFDNWNLKHTRDEVENSRL